MEFRTIGKNIRQYRILRKLRQEDLAERANLSINYVGALERGEKVPSLETFISIINALDISADVILGNTLHSGYSVKDSLLAEKLDSLPPDERSRIYDVIDTLLRHAKKK